MPDYEVLEERLYSTRLFCKQRLFLTGTRTKAMLDGTLFSIMCTNNKY